MKTSPAGLAALCSREGFVAHPYNDPPGSARWSHGYGTICTKDAPPISEADAMAELAAHIAGDEDWILRHVKVPLTQCQFDTLVSFTYNEGEGAFARSTILTRLNAGDVKGAAFAFMPWDKVMKGGVLVVDSNLEARRAGEAAQFLDVTVADFCKMLEPPPTLPDAGQAAHDAIQQAALELPVDDEGDPPPTA